MPTLGCIAIGGTAISAGMRIIENGSYHRLLLMYQGEITPAAILTPADQGDSVLDATVASGVGNWHLYNGRKEEARRIIAMPPFGGVPRWWARPD